MRVVARAVYGALFAAVTARSGRAQVPQGELPLKYAGPPTVPAITAGDLMTRLYIFADDSMMGREIGTANHLRATDYLEREVRRLGLKPAGDSGTYFQRIPVVARAFDTTSTLTVDGITYRGGVDFLASVNAKPWQFANATALYGGVTYDTTNLLTPDQARGKFLLLTAPPAVHNQAELEARAALLRSTGYRMWLRTVSAAAAVATIGPAQIPVPMLRSALNPSGVINPPDTVHEISFIVTRGVAEAMLGVPVVNAVKGATGKQVTSDVRFDDAPRPARNVVAVIPGTDPRLAGEYVVLAAHSDHLGPLDHRDHDSLRISNLVLRPEGALSPPVLSPNNDQWKRIFAMLDSVRKLRPGRIDSIYNGADDDGSGTVSLLEIAEAFASGLAHPARSIALVWFGGEERGNWGSAFFLEHPPFPRDSMVAALNVDLVGRGSGLDETGQTGDGRPLHGGDDYLQVIGSRRASTEFGDLIETVNRDNHLGFSFDYSLDAAGNVHSLYCRAESASFPFGRYGIPAVLFTTGANADFHQVTDEPQYIQYPHLARIDQLVFDVTMAVANLDHRLITDQPKPDPRAPCRP